MSWSEAIVVRWPWTSQRRARPRGPQGLTLDPEALSLRTPIYKAESELPSSQGILWCSKGLPGVGSVFPCSNPPSLGLWTAFAEVVHALGTSTRPPAATHHSRNPQAQPLSHPMSLAQFLGALDRTDQGRAASNSELTHEGRALLGVSMSLPWPRM